MSGEAQSAEATKILEIFYFPIFLKHQKNNESMLKTSSDSRTFGFKIILWSKYSFDQKVEIGPLNDHFRYNMENIRNSSEHDY